MCLMCELKSETKYLHVRLMHSKYFQAMLRGNFSLEMYLNELFGLEVIYSGIESKIQKYKNTELDFIYENYIYKVSWIRDDISYFNHEKFNPKEKVIEKAEKFKEAFCNALNKNIVESFGYLYILEGSALGTFILKKHVVRKLNLTNDGGTKFLSNSQIDVKEHWANLKDYVNNNVSAGFKPSVIEEAINGFKIINEMYAAI